MIWQIEHLADRTVAFSKSVILFCQYLPKTVTNIEITKQLVRSAGSVGANYIEANEALSKKDFLFRIKICRKEAKESHYWIDLAIPNDSGLTQKETLYDEAFQLTKIFGAIVSKCR